MPLVVSLEGRPLDENGLGLQDGNANVNKIVWYDGYGTAVAFINVNAGAMSLNAGATGPVWLSSPTRLSEKTYFDQVQLTLADSGNNNVVIQSVYNAVVGPTTAFAVTGFANDGNNRLLILVNQTSFQMTLRNQQASSDAENRIITGTA